MSIEIKDYKDRGVQVTVLGPNASGTKLLTISGPGGVVDLDRAGGAALCRAILNLLPQLPEPAIAAEQLPESSDG